MPIRYVGPHDEIEIPAAGVVVKQGATFEAEGDIAKSLLDQSENFEAVKATKNKEA